MQNLDQEILKFFLDNRFEWLSFLMLVFTYSGGYLVALTVSVLSSISFLFHRHFSRTLAFLIGVTGSSLSVFILKTFFDKERPAEAFYLESSPSFPSGHASIAIALYGFLLFSAISHENHPYKKPAVWILTLLIILIGLSRLYLGVHYLSDVLVGYLIGLFWLLISIKLEKLFGKRSLS